MRIAVTGSILHNGKKVPRSEFIEIIDSVGFKFDKTVSGKTDYLVVADTKHETTKIKSAKDKGVKIIDYNQLLGIVNEALGL